MRALLLLCLAAHLGAADRYKVVAVERHALPPHEDDQRLYRLEGPGPLSPGTLVQLTRAGGTENPGRLRVVHSAPNGALAVIAQRGDTYPLVGDGTAPWSVHKVPVLPPPEPVATVAPPLALAPMEPHLPRSFREAVYFLPGDGTLSPRGQEKVAGWGREWGAGQWVVEIPAGSGPLSKLLQVRAQAVVAALKGAGVTTLSVKAAPAASFQKPDQVNVVFHEAGAVGTTEKPRH